MGVSAREADIAFVLDDVPNVVAVYAIDGARRGPHAIDYAVRLRPGTMSSPAHYPLLRVMSRAELARVLFFLPARSAARHRPVRSSHLALAGGA